MSIRVMSAVWALDLPDSEKLVLLALADCANDEGRCWPGMASLARKCSKGERTVQGAIKSLCDKGHLTREEVLGKGCNYTVHPRSRCAPAATAPPQPATDTPAAAAPKPSGTTITKKDKPSSRSHAKPKFHLPANIPAEPWAGFEEMRRRIGKPLTDYARGLAVTRLNKLAEDGWPPGEVLNHCTLNSYQGIFPPKDRQNGNGRSLSLRGSRPNPALDMLRQADAEIAAERAAQDQAVDRPAWASLPALGSG